MPVTVTCDKGGEVCGDDVLVIDLGPWGAPGKFGYLCPAHAKEWGKVELTAWAGWIGGQLGILAGDVLASEAAVADPVTPEKP